MTADAVSLSAPRPRRLHLRDVALVARFELAEALRSRLLVVMLLLFVGSGALGAWGYTAIVARAEEKAAEVMGSKAQATGEGVRQLRDSASYADVVRWLVRDEKKAEYFASFPPIVLFYAFASFIFTPWLVLFTSAETIASEVATRAIRFSLLRTGRFAYALGKALGQLAIVIAVTGLSAVVFYFIAWGKLAGFEPGATASGLLAYWPRIVLFTLPFLAWAMFASMATASANFARIVSLGGGVLLAIASGLADGGSPRTTEVGRVLRDLLGLLTPFGHAEGLRYPAGGRFFPDLATCLFLTALYFGAGYFILRRRDV